MFQICGLVKGSQIEHPTPQPSRRVQSFAVTFPELPNPGLPDVTAIPGISRAGMMDQSERIEVTALFH
jgi:hypothetical protein